MNTDIDVAGVISPGQNEAKSEIEGYLSLFEKSFSPEVINIAKVIVAADFERAVDSLLTDLKKSGYKYAAGRRSVKAVGKTVHNIAGNDISFTVVIDGKYIGNWEDDEKAARFEIFYHEFIHAYLSKKRFINLGADGFRNDYRTIEGVCFSLALTRDEYIVDSYLDVMCKKSLTGADNEPLGLKKLNLGRGINYPDIFMQLLADMPDIIGKIISEYQAGKTSVGVMWNRLCAFVEEILTIFAHLAGSQDNEADWDTVKQRISDSEPYKKYLAGHIKKIYLEWIAYFGENYDEAKSLEIIQNEIMEIFHNCGLKFKNVAKGIFITIASGE
mgnify:CR=1 FL=1